MSVSGESEGPIVAPERDRDDGLRPLPPQAVGSTEESARGLGSHDNASAFDVTITHAHSGNTTSAEGRSTPVDDGEATFYGWWNTSTVTIIAGVVPLFSTQ